MPLFKGADLQPDHPLTGPAVVVHPDTTVFIGPADRLKVDEYRNLIVEVGSIGLPR